MTATPPTIPAKPVEQDPPSTWQHSPLFEKVRQTLYILPSYFTSEFSVTGVLSTDLFAFNSSLAATIETQVVEQLNALHNTWDPTGAYAGYTFVRQAQRFPDVILRADTPGATPQIIMGIELKGWYVLAKEGEPSFRYKVTPSICAPQDLLVVYPWALANVTTGSPQLYAPYVVTARYAAEYRNWWWQNGRNERTPGNSGIRTATATNHYPVKSDLIADEALHDSGGNFGRYARTGVMDEYKKERFAERLSGIPIAAWQRFFKIFSESSTDEVALRAVDRLAADFRMAAPELSPVQAQQLRTHVTEVITLLRGIGQ